MKIKTSGDERGDRLAPAGDKARFVREIERALLDREVEIGVHSAKDLPSDLPDGLAIAGVPAREDPLDAYVGEASSLDDVPEGATIGTSSLRRRSQLLAIRSDVDIVDLRGNVDTRLRKLASGDFDGIVLAAAGLRRLGREDEIAFRFDPDQMTPAPGQGALALEVRGDNGDATKAAESLTDPPALAEVEAERAAVAALHASCHTPLGVHADRDGDALRIAGYCGLPDGSEWVRDSIEGTAADPAGLGGELAKRMRAAGADDILAAAEGQGILEAAETLGIKRPGTEK